MKTILKRQKTYQKKEAFRSFFGAIKNLTKKIIIF